MPLKICCSIVPRGETKRYSSYFGKEGGVTFSGGEPLLHKELTKQELELMKPLINSTYLIMNENTHSYFKFTDVERLMEE